MRSGSRPRKLGRWRCWRAYQLPPRTARVSQGPLACTADPSSSTTLWPDRYVRKLEGVFEVRDEIAESIAHALDHAFPRFSTGAVDPAVYDLYLR